MLIDGRKIAQKILDDLKEKTENLKAKGLVPKLYILTLQDDSASKSYVSQKIIKGREIGVDIEVERIDSDIETENLLKTVKNLNADPKINAIIIQRPLPSQIDEEKIAKAIDPLKDVDGFNPNSKFIAPISSAVLEILKNMHQNLKGKESFDAWLKSKDIVIIGRGVTAGQPLIKTFEKLGIKPIVIDKDTTDRDTLLKKADIIISAVGKKRMIENKNLKKGVILISIGMHKEEDGKFYGDYDETDIENKVSFYTPTPGGVGPVNVACLLQNLISTVS
jgi:methylenetetrahydrofolate dehydrogenase (NADP+)/methenyltetrahydrofolate cyclohydrolase